MTNEVPSPKIHQSPFPGQPATQPDVNQMTESLLDEVFQLMGQGEDVLEGTLPDQQPWVLCIDDDYDFSFVLARRLESHGIGVINAYDGRQGCETAFSQPANAIILDYNMPNGQGDYVLRRLKENRITRDIPVIVLTGRREEVVRRAMLNLGAAAFYNKPPNFDELLPELMRHISRCSSNVPAHS